MPAPTPDTPGFRCPQCHEKTRITDSRGAYGNVHARRRRRECHVCRFRFTTHEEMVRHVKIIVVKKNRRQEPFDREKLTKSMRIALLNRNITEQRLNRCIDGILQLIDDFVGKQEGQKDLKTTHGGWALSDHHTIKISSQRMGELVMNTLRELDAIGFIRYAGVFRRFHSPQDYLQLIQSTWNL